MTKFKYFLDFDKEEQWLMDMAEQGYQLKRGGRLFYGFEKAPLENAKIRVDYRDFDGILYELEENFTSYRKQMESKGWKHIAGKPRSGFQYFKQVEGFDDIFPDAASRSERYSRFLKKTSWILILSPFLFLLVGILNLAETFAMQVLWGILFLIVVAFDIFFGIRLRMLSKKALRNEEVSEQTLCASKQNDVV